MPLKNRVLAKFYPTPHDKADLEALAKRTGSHSLSWSVGLRQAGSPWQRTTSI